MSQNIVVTDLDRLRHSCSASQSDASPFFSARRGEGSAGMGMGAVGGAAAHA